jgi:hypothetical protein
MTQDIHLVALQRDERAQDQQCRHVSSGHDGMEGVTLSRMQFGHDRAPARPHRQKRRVNRRRSGRPSGSTTSR